MAQTRYYRNGSPASTLSGNINAAVTTVPVTAVTTWPSTVPYTITVDKGLSTAEVMLVTFVSGLNLTVTRGYDGTTAVSHGIGAAVQPTVIALDFTEANAHANATTGVHGAAGSVVGTTATQTLSGKTLTSPVLTGPSITGGVTVTGTAALAATTASSVTTSGTVQGATVTSTGNVGANTLTTTSNASIGGTLGVTGAVSANAGVTTTTLTTSGAASLASGSVTAAPTTANHLVNKTYADAILPTPSTAARGYRATTQVANPSAVITLPSESYDYGNNMAATTGVYTAPATGLYEVHYRVEYGAASGAEDGFAQIINQAGTVLTQSSRFIIRGVTGGDTMAPAGSDVIPLTAGNTVRLQLTRGAGGSVTVAAGAETTFMAIRQVD